MSARLYMLIALSLLIGVIFPGHSFAQSKDGLLEVVPAFVEVTIEPHQEQATVPIFIANNSDDFVSLQLFPIDFKQQDGTGAISFLGQQGSYSYSLSSFLSFETETLELAPREKKEFQVTIKNRQDLSPGGHYAAVVAKMLPGSERPDQAGVAPSVSSLILVRKVGGEQFNLSLKEISWPKFPVIFTYPRTVSLLFQNEGNIHLTPYGRVAVSDMFGRLLYDGSINTSSNRVFPSSRRYIASNLSKLSWAFPISFNTMEIRGQDSLKKTTFIQTESFIYINPWFGLGMIILGYGLYHFHNRLRRRKRLNEIPYDVTPEKTSKKPLKKVRKKQ